MPRRRTQRRTSRIKDDAAVARQASARREAAFRGYSAILESASTPRPDGSNSHVSYHVDGTYHHKSHGRTLQRKQLQRLDQPFKGTVNLGGFAGHGPKTVGAVCDPSLFAGAVELFPGVLGPRDGTVLVDLVEPGSDPITWPDQMVHQKVYKDAKPWILIRVFRTPLPRRAKSVKRRRRSHRQRTRQRRAAHARRLRR